MGNSSINGPFSIAMLNNQRVDDLVRKALPSFNMGFSIAMLIGDRAMQCFPIFTNVEYGSIYQ